VAAAIRRTKTGMARAWRHSTPRGMACEFPLDFRPPASPEPAPARSSRQFDFDPTRLQIRQPKTGRNANLLPLHTRSLFASVAPKPVRQIARPLGIRIGRHNPKLLADESANHIFDPTVVDQEFVPPAPQQLIRPRMPIPLAEFFKSIDLANQNTKYGRPLRRASEISAVIL